MSARVPVTILLTSAGAPGSAALIRALHERTDHDVRVVGVDLRDEAIGRFRCDAFAVVPRSDDPGYADAVLAIAQREGAAAVIPQASADLPGLAAAHARFAAAGKIGRAHV